MRRVSVGWGQLRLELCDLVCHGIAGMVVLPVVD